MASVSSMRRLRAETTKSRQSENDKAGASTLQRLWRKEGGFGKTSATLLGRRRRRIVALCAAALFTSIVGLHVSSFAVERWSSRANEVKWCALFRGHCFVRAVRVGKSTTTSDFRAHSPWFHSRLSPRRSRAQRPRTRGSTGLFWGKHLLDIYCGQHQNIALSSGEAELREMVN